MSRWTEFLRTLAAYAERFDQHVGRPCRVLLVDDECAICRFGERVLGHAGYGVTSVTDSIEALRKFDDEGPFDVLVTDFHMPQMDGAELARHLRARTPDVKVLYITGYADALFQKKERLWMNEAFLEKPCSPAGLLQAVAMLLQENRVQRTAWV